jgi:acetyl esterase/lipase
MTLQMAAFLETAAQVVDGPIALSGHSAGGHLASRLLCEDVAVPDSVRGRVARVVSISGLHDLRPLRFTKIGEALRLQPGEATAESPALHRPVEGARLLAWVGEDERPEFLRQAELIANIWAGLGAETRLAVEPGRHHFDVIAGLSEPDSPLTEALLGW